MIFICYKYCAEAFICRLRWRWVIGTNKNTHERLRSEHSLKQMLSKKERKKERKKEEELEEEKKTRNKPFIAIKINFAILIESKEHTAGF